MSVLMLPVLRLKVISTVARSYMHLLALGSNGPTTDTETVLLPENYTFNNSSLFFIQIKLILYKSSLTNVLKNILIVNKII